jgi:hypothetical protein
MANTNSFVCLQPSGHYGDALRYKGLLKIGQSFVIDYKSFIRFANTGQVSEPVFVSDNYADAIAEAKRLNDLRQEM